MSLHALRHTKGLAGVARALTLVGILLTLGACAICSDADGATAAKKHASQKAPAVAPAIVCSGTLAAPGVLAGAYSGNVAVKGVCEVNEGLATVAGNLTVLPGSGLVAAYSLDDSTKNGESKLTVGHNLLVEHGASAILGCESLRFTCLDQIEDGAPQYGSVLVKGNLEEQRPLGVVVHNSVVDGSIIETGGGDGFRCPTAGVGVFALFKSPVYSDYEDTAVGGSVTVSKIVSCWMGLARDTVYGSMSILRDRLFDPDAIEILSNKIDGNLTCEHNSNVWDSTDYLHTLWPRRAEPNTVQGKRVGECVLASAATEGAQLGPSPF